MFRCFCLCHWSSRALSSSRGFVSLLALSILPLLWRERVFQATENSRVPTKASKKKNKKKPAIHALRLQKYIAREYSSLSLRLALYQHCCCSCCCFCFCCCRAIPASPLGQRPLSHTHIHATHGCSSSSAAHSLNLFPNEVQWYLNRSN